MRQFHSPAALRGITLIELMVVVAIIAILAAVAYPTYQEQVLKTRRAEGKTALNEVASRLERCFTRFNNYTPNCNGVASMTSENGFYQVSASAIAASSYTLQAAPVPGRHADPKCGTLTLNHVGVRGQSGSPPSGYQCW